MKIKMERDVYCKYILALSDFLCCLLSFVFTFLTLSFFDVDLNTYIPSEQTIERAYIYSGLVIFCISWFWIRLRHYTYRKPFWYELKEIIRTIIIISIIDLAIIAFSKLYFSRYLWIITWSMALFFLPLGRIVTKKMLIKLGLYLKDTIIIGGGKNAIDAYNALVSEPYLGFKIKYFISNCPEPELLALGIPILGDKNDGIWEVVTNKNDQFILALEDNETFEKDKWVRELAKKNYRFVSVIPTLRGLPLYSTDMSFIFSYDVILLRLNNNLAKRTSRITKRLFDIVVSLLFILLLSPLFIVLFLLIWISGGNVVYGHTRIGRNKEKFKCYKFRSMVNNADKVLESLLQDPNIRKEWDRDFKLKNDPRITFIGRFIRRYSLDELPQLFNVLIGQMSLVGPRPIVESELKYYGDDVDYYLMAKPGMTGLWQVSGRNDIDYEKRVYFDVWYVKNWSLWNDVAILFKTINVVLKRNGAY